MKNVRGYIFSRHFLDNRIPQHVQNLVIRNYCDKNHLHYLLSVAEYAMPKCHIIFDGILKKELVEIDGIVLYSMFQLPENDIHRKYIYAEIIKQKKILYFAVENSYAKTQKQFDEIEIIWKVCLSLSHCLKVEEILQYYSH